MWSLAIKILTTQMAALTLVIILWSFHSDRTKKILVKNRPMAGAILWAGLFLLTVSASGITTAAIVSTTTIILTSTWLRYKNYTYTKKQDSVISKGPTIINI
jgi:hypothetical protein